MRLRSSTRRSAASAAVVEYESIPRGDQGRTLRLTGAVLAAPIEVAQLTTIVTAGGDGDTYLLMEAEEHVGGADC